MKSELSWHMFDDDERTRVMLSGYWTALQYFGEGTKVKR